MTNPHVPEDLLQRFAANELDTPVAVDVARHLDECSVCAARASALDPLQAHFAGVLEPAIPDDFVAQVLARAERPERVGRPEWWIASALFAASGLVFLLAGRPAESLATLAALGQAVWVLGSSLAGLSGPVLALCGLFGFSLSVVAARTMERAPEVVL